MKPYDYTKVKSYPLYWVALRIGHILKYIVYDFHVAGLENVPEKGTGGFILACNHINYRDPALLAIAVGKKKHAFHFMGKYELFQKPAIAWLLTRFNGFPIKRGERDTVALEYACEVVRSGNVLGIFPEGKRSADGTPTEPKKGIAVIARDTKANVLPAAIYSETKGAFFTKVTVRFGKMIPYEELHYSGSGDVEECKEVAEQIMAEIRALWEEGHCE